MEQEPFQVGPEMTYLPSQAINYGPKSQKVTCPYCRALISTKISAKATSKTHMWACCLILFCCWLCCCCPYCIDSCQNVNHSCPACHAFLGTYAS